VSSKDAEVKFHIDGPIARVHLNRPTSLNAVTPKMNASLHEAWCTINAEPSVRVVLLTGEGERAFCVGADLKASTQPEGRIAFGGGITGIGGPLLVVEKPIVAAVQGHVLGGGFELALCADIIVAADTTSFGLPETAVGVIGECGVVHRAMRQLPYRIALSMILTGSRLGAADAAIYGLVNEVVPHRSLEAAAGRWVDLLLAASPLAVQAAKDAALSRLGHPLADALSSRFERIEAYAATEDARESRRAFAEKRPPVWKGH
jgi:enoyl-CoA hydratase/carnithine racemase